MITKTPFSVLTLFALSLALTTSAHAYLGSFTPQDGYHVQSGLVYGDVSYYNAGQYGANAGGGPGPTQITANSGLWSVIGPAGGYFSNAADRLNYTTGAPPYAAGDANAVASYFVGGHGGGRTDNFNLALRNDIPLGTGAEVYDYELDSFDFGGITPANVTSGPVKVGFYFCPNPGDTPNPGSAPSDKFTMSFKDSLGNIGFQWGYLRDNAVVWRANASGPWIPTAFIADQFNWDGLTVDLDLTADTFSMDYFDVSTATTTNFVPVGTPMGQAMNDLTVLGWRLEDGLFAGNAGKNFFDDFSFTATVPEPGSCLLMLASLSGLLIRRR